MASRWFNIVLVALCIYGCQAFSPIREGSADEEWAEYYQMLRDPSYRLPTTTRPSHYAVTLAPILEVVPSFLPEGEPFTFDGEAIITIQATENNVNEIVLHCNDLRILFLIVYAATDTTPTNIASGTNFECEMPRSFLRIPLTEVLDQNRQYIIQSSFKGNLQTNMRGFYRSWYVDSSGNRRWMATTQFQPGHARQAFPCYDEPGFKARFDITMIREASFSPTLSNMPIRADGTVTRPDSRIAESFYTTTKTSTYLIAFIVSHYKQVASGDDPNRIFHIYARDNIGNHGDWALEIGEKLLTAMENYTDSSYYEMTDNIIMQQAAIPDFSAGAMENWGLLTYREALILYDPLNSNHFYRQRVANIVSHEIVHMWFGNLVTCAWWDNLWLNEGFARFYQYFLTGLVAEEMGYSTRFIVEQEHQALLSDSFDDTAHALTNPNVNDPTTVSAHFSTITYAKGAAVLRMTQYLLGVNTYQRALQNYLRNNQFDVAEPQTLFDELDAAAAEDNALSAYGGINVAEYMSTWTLQAGHPILTVVVDHTTGRMTVTQERFSANSLASSITTQWHVPITWTRASNIDFEDLKPSQILTETVHTLNRGTVGREWVIFNKQQSGFYRVNYDPTTWGLITQALRDDNTRPRIHEYNRAQIVDDVFVMARAGRLSYTEAFNILSFLQFEDQYAPWIAAITGFDFSRRRLAHSTANTELLHKLAIDLSVAVSGRLGFNEREGESYMDGLLRMYLNTFLCNVGHDECVQAGIASFANWRNNNGFIPANMRPWVYCTGLRYGNAADFQYFWQRYLTEDLASEQVVMLTAAGCTNDEGSLGTFLNAITAGPNDFTIREQDRSTALSSALTSNEANTMRAFNWLKENVDRTTTALGSISSPLNTITSRLLNEEQIAEVLTWLNANQAQIGEASYNTGIRGIATARSNIEWYSRRAGEYERYFQIGYEEPVFDEPTSTTPTTTTTTTSSTATTPDPNGSANMMGFSIITLIVMVALNMA